MDPGASGPSIGDCEGCGFKVTEETKAPRTGSDGLWHVECYVCNDCHVVLKHGLFHELKDNLVCRNCYARMCLGDDFTDFFASAAYSASSGAGRRKEPLPAEAEQAEVKEPSGKKDPEDMGTYISYAIGMAVMQAQMEAEKKISKKLRAEDFTDVTEMQPVLNKVNFYFADHAPQVFSSIRQKFGITNNDYVVSIVRAPLKGGTVGAGKSGMLFYFSDDNKYIIKTVTPSELPFFMKCLRDYYTYMSENENTLLPRFYGLYKVKLPGRKVVRIIAMSNVFLTPYDIHEKYDLKGSTYQREVGEDEMRDNHPGVLKDLNFKQQIKMGKDKKALMEQVRLDADFLIAHNMMDYSLLLGIHKADPAKPAPAPNPRKEPAFKSIWQKDGGGFRTEAGGDIFFFGIIDILQEYNLKKKVENAYKSKRVAEPDSISAVDAGKYAKRFVAYIDSITVED